MPAVLDAFTSVRTAAEEHMDSRNRAGLGWSEESVTEVAIHRGLPTVRVVQFTRQQEGRGVGADYLWWWLDEASDECFGMLVQAKRLQRQGSRWTVDIGYNNGGQLRDLLRTADQFDVPAMYGVYTGGQVFRNEVPCSHSTASARLRCRRMAISLISAYQVVDTRSSPRDTGTRVQMSGIPLEDLVDPALPAGVVRDVNHAEVGPELREFLLAEQRGPREVAKRIFKAVVDQRSGQLAAALAERATLAGAPLFPDVPADPGHYPGSYFAHVLRGLRTSPPDYVRELRAGRAVLPDVPRGVAGVVLVTL